MLDPKFVKENLAAVAQAAQHKGFSFDPIRFTELFDKRLISIEKTESLRQKRNEGSQAVKSAQSGDERAKLVSQMKTVNEELARAEAENKEVEEQLRAVMMRTPNVFSKDTPIGKDDSENVEVKKVGTPALSSQNSRSHIDIGQALGIVDFQRGTQIAGSRSYFLKGQGAMLERAVHSFAMDLLIERGFTPFSIPVLVNSSAMEGTGYLPGGEDQAYFVEKDDFWLVGTSEVSLASFRGDEILLPEELPLKYCAHSSCFRREAGAHGKDTKGLYRVHQFQKIEQVILCYPDIEESDKLHNELLKNAEDIVQALELPYHVVAVCSGDLGLGQVKKHDIEVWMPGRDNYGETHSCSSFYDFQARRLKIRVKDKEGKTRPVFTLNNTAAATPRLLIPLLENHQVDGGERVRIPEVLRKYMGNKTHIEKEK